MVELVHATPQNMPWHHWKLALNMPPIRRSDWTDLIYQFFYYFQPIFHGDVGTSAGLCVIVFLEAMSAAAVSVSAAVLATVLERMLGAVSTARCWRLWWWKACWQPCWLCCRPEVGSPVRCAVGLCVGNPVGDVGLFVGFLVGGGVRVGSPDGCAVGLSWRWLAKKDFMVVLDAGQNNRDG